MGEADDKKAIHERLMGLSVLEAARILMPDASDEELESIIWGATGFPAFWRTDNPAAELVAQLRVAAEMRKAGTLDEHIRKAWELRGTHDERVKDADP